MKSWLLLLSILLILSVPGSAKELDPAGKAACVTLKTTAYFATGGIGYAGMLSEGEKALRVLLKQKEAESALQSLLKEANTAGQMYALVGLKQINPAAFAKVLPPYLKSPKTLKTMYGCMAGEKTVAVVAAEIEHGDHPLRAQRPSP